MYALLKSFFHYSRWQGKKKFKTVCEWLLRDLHLLAEFLRKQEFTFTDLFLGGKPDRVFLPLI